MKNKYIVLFAAPVGTSKTPIAHFLSSKLSIPVHSNDAIRSEVAEDLLFFDQKEYEKRRDKRLEEIFKKGNPFILDASIDREWDDNYKKLINESNYKIFIISIDLSKEFIVKLFKTKDYTAFDKLDGWIKDHEEFLEKYKNLVNFHITDENFKDRLKLSAEKLQEWIRI
ncbi:MAG: hypothetical protein COU25_02430 [Candidatus Levybacteria bacterium CG10_big_fil_rev_8_21_14_0_10_35_13]|nr:MAG: hypothetical protein COU25_02430 [Candidatus Levybacteria bacterium CG10_big_fil_rev_8_21_14_0_10_35_13]